MEDRERKHIEWLKYMDSFEGGFHCYVCEKYKDPHDLYGIEDGKDQCRICLDCHKKLVDKGVITYKDTQENRRKILEYVKVKNKNETS